MTYIPATEYIQVMNFKKGDYLFIEGDDTKFFYLLRSGNVEIFITDKTEAKIPLAIISEGQAIGEFAMICNQPRSATAQAITDVEAMKVSEEGYRRMFNELPDWATAVVESLVIRLSEANDIIRRHRIVDKELEERVAEIKNKKA